ncbi:hypothetical protein AB0395_28745 [Streptosporangium sp. NPDC051023]|uniref:hypothetical protein n=1 Tax=Streptosporangium sp. NPDC051023 TaxID=3155410 RepID=UPI00345056D9
MITEDEPTSRECPTCHGRGWRWGRRSRAEVALQLDGQAVKLVQVECLDCPAADEAA